MGFFSVNLSICNQYRSGFLLESEMDATTLDCSSSCSTERLREALSDERNEDMLSLMICWLTL